MKSIRQRIKARLPGAQMAVGALTLVAAACSGGMNTGNMGGGDVPDLSVLPPDLVVADLKDPVVKKEVAAYKAVMPVLSAVFGFAPFSSSSAAMS